MTSAQIDFLRIAAEYCKHIEQCNGVERKDFIDTMRFLLPQLYLKVSALEEIEDADGFNEPKVTEEDYNYIRASVNAVMGECDDYLDVFVEDFKYSDQPVLRTVSEDLADIYQPLRDLLEIVRSGFDDAIRTSLEETRQKFELYWGQAALNALRAMHDVRFNGKEN